MYFNVGLKMYADDMVSTRTWVRILLLPNEKWILGTPLQKEAQ